MNNKYPQKFRCFHLQDLGSGESTEPWVRMAKGASSSPELSQHPHMSNSDRTKSFLDIACDLLSPSQSHRPPLHRATKLPLYPPHFCGPHVGASATQKSPRLRLLKGLLPSRASPRSVFLKTAPFVMYTGLGLTRTCLFGVVGRETIACLLR